LCKTRQDEHYACHTQGDTIEALLIGKYPLITQLIAQNLTIKYNTRNSAVADKPRDTFEQMQ